MIREIAQALAQAGANIRSRIDEARRDHEDRRSIVPFIDQARESLESARPTLRYRYPRPDHRHAVVKMLRRPARARRARH